MTEEPAARPAADTPQGGTPRLRVVVAEPHDVPPSPARAGASPGRLRTPLLLLQAMRPVQWTKNLLVFAALIFAQRLNDPSALAASAGAFVAFCLAASGVYLANDIRDRDQDLIHPLKRWRPIASGTLNVRVAAGTAVVVTALALAIASVVQLRLAAVLLLYVLIMAGYNLGLKRFVMVDVLIIAAGFVIRAVAGAVAIDVPISPWLYLCTFLLALLVGLGKRRHELLTLELVAGQHRQNLESYSLGLLDQLIAVTASATVLAYAIYTVQSPAVPRDHAMLLTVPLVLYAVFRYLYLIYRKRLGGSPETLLLRDRPLLATAILWVVVSIAILYRS